MLLGPCFLALLAGIVTALLVIALLALAGVIALEACFLALQASVFATLQGVFTGLRLCQHR